MQTIQLLKGEAEVFVNGKMTKGPITTLDLIEIAINSPIKGGYSITEMRERLRIKAATSKLDKDAVQLTLEDADYEKLKQLVTETRWGIVSQFIADFDASFK